MSVERAMDAERAKVERRLAQIAPRLKPLLAEYRQLRARLDELDEIERRWANAPRVATAVKLRTAPVRGVEDRMQDILECLGEHGALSPRELSTTLRCGRQLVDEPLRRLVTQGRVVATGSTRDRRYALACAHREAAA